MRTMRFGATVALLTVCAVVIMTGAEVSAASTTVSSVVSPVISLFTTNGTVNLNVTPTASGVQTVSNDTVAVSTNDSAGYTLQLAESGAASALTSANGTIPAVSGTQSAPLAETASTWGYRVDGLGGFGSGPTTASTNSAVSSAKFAAVPAAGSPNTLKTTSGTASNDTTSIWYGAAVNTATPSGTYTNSVTYTATAN